MTPVRRRDLLVLAVGLAVASWLLVRTYYGMLPPLRWWLPLPLAVLAQASAYVGAVFAGIWVGVLLHVGPAVRRLQAAGSDTVTASVGIVSSFALVAAALWLESVCRVPPEEDGPTEGVSA